MSSYIFCYRFHLYIDYRRSVIYFVTDKHDCVCIYAHAFIRNVTFGVYFKVYILCILFTMNWCSNYFYRKHIQSIDLLSLSIISTTKANVIFNIILRKYGILGEIWFIQRLDSYSLRSEDMDITLENFLIISKNRIFDYLKAYFWLTNIWNVNIDTLTWSVNITELINKIFEMIK